MLTVDDVMRIHDHILREESGLHGHHGVGAINGALTRVINAREYAGMDDVFEIAAMYAVAISRGHVFNDANKRTALVCALTYLKEEDIWIPRSPELEDVMVDVAQGTINETELAEILYSLSQRNI
jgi:death-on-curing protein